MASYHLFPAVIFSVVLSCTRLNAQKIDSIPSVCLNHVLIYLDTVTYNNLFNSSFLSDSVGICQANSVKTTDQQYSGKYLFGEEGYLEFFPAIDVNINRSGAFGFGFMTFRSGDIWKIRDDWQKHTAEPIGSDTTFFDNKGIKESWFYSIGIDRSDTNTFLPVWLMENTPEHMKKVGFSDADLKERITWGTYSRQIVKSGPYPRLLNGITSVNVSVGSDEMDYLQKIITGLGLHQKGSTFSNQYVKIVCEIKPYSISRIQTITFGLKQDVTYRKLIISDYLILELEGKSAVFTFK